MIRVYIAMHVKAYHLLAEILSKDAGQEVLKICN